VNESLRSEVFEIRRVLARTGAFEGYRAAPVALSGFIALAAGAAQRLLHPDPIQFVVLWAIAAALGFGINFMVVARTYGASPRQWERSLAFAALLDLMPAMAGGALLTGAMIFTQRIALLPGIWMVLFGTGVMASRRHVPRGCAWIGVAYLLAGVSTLVLLPGAGALRADVMAGTFGLGQFLLSWVLARSALSDDDEPRPARPGVRP
jgi:hypothetical protein